MQTFLPYSDFAKSAAALDKKRLWKQVVEAKQILCILNAKRLPNAWTETKSFINRPFINHPAVKMWKGYENWLKFYFNVFLSQAIRSGINTDMKLLSNYAFDMTRPPWWLYNDKFHKAMRARLIEKDRDFYLKQWPESDGYNNGNYWWPDNKTEIFKLINPK